MKLYYLVIITMSLLYACADKKSAEFVISTDSIIQYQLYVYKYIMSDVIIDSITSDGKGNYFWKTDNLGEFFFISNKIDGKELKEKLVFTTIAEPGKTHFKVFKDTEKFEAGNGLNKKLAEIICDPKFPNLDSMFLRTAIMENADNVLGAFLLDLPGQFIFDKHTFQEFARKIDDDVLNNTFIGNKLLRYKYPAQQLPSIIVSDTLENFKTINVFEEDLVFIDFWASWCAPCRVEMRKMKHILLPQLVAKNKKLQIISISTDSDRSRWLGAVKEEQSPWLQYLEEPDKNEIDINNLLTIRTIPHGVLIDKSGKIIANRIQTSEALLSHLEKYWGD